MAKGVGNPLIFKDSEVAKLAIMDSQKKEIAALYESWADEIGERAKYYSHKSTASAPVSERYYRELQKQLRQTSQEVSNEIYKKIKSNIYTVADAVVSDNVKWLADFGFSVDGLNAAFSYVPDEIVRNLVTGQIYESGWSLSSRIWSDNEATLKDIYQVMAKGLAENKPIYEIAKDLESYVRPGAKLPWNLRMADGKKIYKKQVDYNAQRLARTLVQHGYQQSFIATTQKNPFITEYIWRSNGSRVCDLCKARDGVHYKKTELPMDHPNGMCTMEPVVAENMIDQLADWFNSPDGTYPEIDEFAGNFGYQASKTSTVQDFIAKYGMSSKSPSSWFNSLTQIQKAEAKALKEQSDLTWNEWYEKYIYAGSKTNIATNVTTNAMSKSVAKSTIKTTSKITNTNDNVNKVIKRSVKDNSLYDGYRQANKAESIAEIMKEIPGIDEKTAAKYNTAIKKYTGGDFGKIMDAFLSGDTKSANGRNAKNLQEYLERAPTWNNSSPLFRGVSIKPEELDNVLKNYQPGTSFDSKVFNSFSNNFKTALSYSKPKTVSFGGKVYKNEKATSEGIVFRVDKTSNAVPIAKYSSYVVENEVMMPANVKFEVVSVTRKTAETDSLGNIEIKEYIEIVLKEII
jgi:hypothetical protein